MTTELKRAEKKRPCHPRKKKKKKAALNVVKPAFDVVQRRTTTGRGEKALKRDIYFLKLFFFGGLDENADD